MYKDVCLQSTSPGSNQQAGTPYTFNLNSLFQPRSGGHQPFGFDQLAALYQRYKVNKVKVMVQSDGGSSAAGFQVLAVLPPGSTQTTLNLLTAGQFGENFNGSTIRLSNNSVVPIVYERTFDIAEVAGLTKSEMAANIEDYSALVTASPTRVVTMEVNYAPDLAAQTVFHHVTLVFVAEFWQRVSLGQS